jgi:hypothetical protein
MASSEDLVVPGVNKVDGRQHPPRNRSILGRNFIFSPEVIDDIHIKAELGRYRIPAGS